MVFFGWVIMWQGKSKAIFILLLLLFVTFLLLLLLLIVGTSISTSARDGASNFALDDYWVPILTFVLLVQSLNTSMCSQNGKLPNNDPFQVQSRRNGRETSSRYCCSSLESKLDFVWEYVCASLTPPPTSMRLSGGTNLETLCQEYFQTTGVCDVLA